MTGELQLPIEQHPEEIRRLALAEDGLPRWERDFRAQPRKGVELLVGELLEEEGGPQIVDEHYILSRY